MIRRSISTLSANRIYDVTNTEVTRIGKSSVAMDAVLVGTCHVNNVQLIAMMFYCNSPPTLINDEKGRIKYFDYASIVLHIQRWTFEIKGHISSHKLILMLILTKKIIRLLGKMNATQKNHPPCHVGGHCYHGDQRAHG